MINLLNIADLSIVAFAGVIFAFAVTCVAISKFSRFLPKDMGRQFAHDGKLSAGKPRGAGIIFIFVFVLPFEYIYIIYYYILFVNSTFGTSNVPTYNADVTIYHIARSTFRILSTSYAVPFQEVRLFSSSSKRTPLLPICFGVPYGIISI